MNDEERDTKNDRIEYMGVRDKQTKEFVPHDRSDDEDTEEVFISRSKPE